MKKKNISNYDQVKKYNAKRVAQGWKRYLAFGPPELIEQVKKLIKDYKKQHNLYKYNMK